VFYINTELRTNSVISLFFFLIHEKNEKCLKTTFLKLFIWPIQGVLVNWIRIRIPDLYPETVTHPATLVGMFTKTFLKSMTVRPSVAWISCERLKVLTETCLQVPGQFKLASSWLPRKTWNKNWEKLFANIFWQWNLALFYAKLYMLKKLQDKKLQD